MNTDANLDDLMPFSAPAFRSAVPFTVQITCTDSGVDFHVLDRAGRQVALPGLFVQAQADGLAVTVALDTGDVDVFLPWAAVVAKGLNAWFLDLWLRAADTDRVWAHNAHVALMASTYASHSSDDGPMPPAPPAYVWDVADDD